MSIGSTLSTNSVELLYLISNRHQTWYRPKGLPHIIQVQSSQHHPCSFICKFITQIDNMLIKKLHLINPYQVIRFPFQTIYYIGCFTYNKRLYLSSFVRYDMVCLVAIVLLGLKRITFCLAITALLILRINSSVLPLNIDPQINSILPGWLDFLVIVQ